MIIYKQIGISLLCRDLSEVNTTNLSESLGIAQGDLPQACLDATVDTTRIPTIGEDSLGGSLQIGTEYHAVRFACDDGCTWCVQVSRIDPAIVTSDEERWMVSVGPLVNWFNRTLANDSSRWEPFLKKIANVGLMAHKGPAIGPDVALIWGIMTSNKKAQYTTRSLSEFLWPVQVDRCSEIAQATSYWQNSLGEFCFHSFYEPRDYYGWLAEGISPKQFGVTTKRWVKEFPCYRNR